MNLIFVKPENRYGKVLFNVSKIIMLMITQNITEKPNNFLFQPEIFQTNLNTDFRQPSKTDNDTLL